MKEINIPKIIRTYKGERNDVEHE